MKERYEEYECDYVTITGEDDDCLSSLKAEIMRLPLAERKIMVMYMEAGTYSEVAKALRCSVPTVSKKVRLIREKLLKKTEKICRDL